MHVARRIDREIEGPELAPANVSVESYRIAASTGRIDRSSFRTYLRRCVSAFDGASNHGENHGGIIYELDPQAILYCSLQYARGTRRRMLQFLLTI